MKLYAETSAVLRWLLAGPAGDAARERLGKAEAVFASRLTLVEARRSLARQRALGILTEAQAQRAKDALAESQARWNIMEVVEEVWRRAEEAFPVEPVRALDALHLATALRFEALQGGVHMLSYDARILDNWRAVGLAVA